MTQGHFAELSQHNRRSICDGPELAPKLFQPIAKHRRLRLGPTPGLPRIPTLCNRQPSGE